MRTSCAPPPSTSSTSRSARRSFPGCSRPRTACAPPAPPPPSCRAPGPPSAWSRTPSIWRRAPPPCAPSWASTARCSRSKRRRATGPSGARIPGVTPAATPAATPAVTSVAKVDAGPGEGPDATHERTDIVLGIDTSCDDTGVGVVIDGRVAANVVVSQTALHARFGGVVPEAASREHLEVLDEVVTRALTEAGMSLDEITAVAATRGPGLVGALLVGLSYGKALAWGLSVPFVPVHHLEGHLAAAASVEPPFVALIASGGHTALFRVDGWDHVEVLGRSRDDAAGEAFDKVARLLGLG